MTPEMAKRRMTSGMTLTYVFNNQLYMIDWRQFVYAHSENLAKWFKKNDDEPVDKAVISTNDEVIAPLSKDIASLEKRYGPFKEGMRLEVTLTEMLECCPRERKRSDAYRSLAKELKTSKNVELVVTSRKKGG